MRGSARSQLSVRNSKVREAARPRFVPGFCCYHERKQEQSADGGLAALVGATRPAREIGRELAGALRRDQARPICCRCRAAS
jgi:hypothetical protein